MSSTVEKAKKDTKRVADERSDKAKNVKLDKAKQSDIREKTYTTRQVETSVTLLDSPENDVVLEALLFLSKYADVNKNNPLSLIRSGVIEKLIRIFDKNICILRISLRLLAVLLDSEDSLYEIDQDKYDEKIVEIANMYIEHKDGHVKEFCAEILAKIASSCRITTIIFQVNLFNAIFDNIKSTKNETILYYSIKLLLEILDAPAAVSALPDCNRFDPNAIVTLLHHKDRKISNLSLDVIEKLSKYILPFLQESFKKAGLVEKMFKIIMDDEKAHQHGTALNIVHNCLNSEETCSYYIESVEFLEMCQFVKTCHPKFLLPLIEIFIKLTSIPELKQILFDLSVEESILYFFRCKNKPVINKTCLAVSNMTTHKYCCEHMLTPVIAGTLVEILERLDDDEDPFNEVALQTVFHFIRRNLRALDIFLDKNLKPVLLDYLYNKAKVITRNSFLIVLEILYKCMVQPKHRDEFISDEILKEVLKVFQDAWEPAATMCCEIMSNITILEKFRNVFLQNNGPQICLKVLKGTEDISLVTQILYLIFSCLIYEDIAMAFLRKGLIPALKNFNEQILVKVPIWRKVLHMALNYYPPIKFYETGRLEISDKLPNKFYLINGHWNGPFPFLEVLEIMQVSPYPTIYLVDYSYKVTKGTIEEVQSQCSLQSFETLLSSSSVSRSFSGMSLPEVPSAFDISYGGISKDIFLPRYIYHINKYEPFLQGKIEDRIRFLAEYVDTLLCGPKPGLTMPQKIHEFKLHIQCLKEKLGNNVIPIGFLRLGFHCERALLFKALADKICIPCSLVQGSPRVYWNEVALFEKTDYEERIKFYIVDLMAELGNLMLVGSREANKYCNLN